jgi:hypothetical protein
MFKNKLKSNERLFGETTIVALNSIVHAKKRVKQISPSQSNWILFTRYQIKVTRKNEHIYILSELKELNISINMLFAGICHFFVAIA